MSFTLLAAVALTLPRVVGNDVALRWWRWDDADSYTGDIDLDRSTGSGTSFKVPMDAKAGETIHVVAEATDNGSSALTRYERFVVTVSRAR